MLNTVFFLVLSIGVFWFRPSTENLANKHFPPHSTLDQSHFGFNLVLSDLLWLDYIQHAYECSNYVAGGKNCAQRWGYLTLNEATELDPKFKELYYHGAVKLSVILSDHEGAGEIFERGVKHNKDSWLIYYRAAYVNLIELNNPEKAADYLNKSSTLGAPIWAKSLASKLYTKSGKVELGYRLLYELYQEAEEGPWKKDLEQRLSATAETLRKNSKSF